MVLRRKSGTSLLTERLRVKQGATTVRRTMHIRNAPRALTWSAEKIGGGGFVTGIAISPDGLTRLVRTDVGAGWRWDTTSNRWEPLVTIASMPANDTSAMPYGGEGVQALIAGNSAAYMGYAGAIYKSTDRGLHWTNVKTGIPTGPNTNDQRWWNRHMMIDPNNASRIVYGSFSSGVWFSADAGATWTQTPSSSVPFGLAGWGIPVVGIGNDGALWAAPYQAGVYRSTDSGANWTKISDDAMFVSVTGLGFTASGDVLATGMVSGATISTNNPAVYRYRSGAWTAITIPGSPSGSRVWRSVAVDPYNPGRVVIQASGGYCRITTDNGDTWSAADVSFNDPDGDVTWLPAANGGLAGISFFTTVGGLQFDPVVSGRIWMTQGIGVWYADLATITPAVIAWNTRTRGLEELVVNDVLAAPSRQPIAMCWDRPIFVMRESGDAYPTHYHPTNGAFSSAWQADYSTDADLLVATIANHQNGGSGTPAQSGTSTDGGHTWTPFPAIPADSTNANGTFGFGSVHVSGNYLIWVSSNNKGAYRSADLGATWTKITTFTDSLWNSKQYFVLRHPVAAEKVAGRQGTFYAYLFGLGIYKSTDGGATWSQRCDQTQFPSAGGTVTYDWHLRLKAVPGQAGHLYLTPGRLGSFATPVTGTPLLRSRDGGTTWRDVGLREISAFDFGKSAPGRTYPSIYATGRGSDGLGAYRSIDGGDTWSLLGAVPLVTGLTTIAASKTTYGLVWVGSSGQGVARGEYVNA